MIDKIISFIIFIIKLKNKIMKPFLILQLRPENPTSDNEFEAIVNFSGLDESETHRIRMEQGGLPEINLNDYSGIIVGGGPWNVSDDQSKKSKEQKNAEVWLDKLIDEVIEKDFPFLGACYGFGALAIKNNGVVNKEQYTEEPSAIDITLTDEAKNDPLLQGLPETFRAMVGHKESCQKLPENAVWLARAEACPYEMFRIGKNIYATQFHPELETEGFCLRVEIYKNAGYFPPEDAEKLKEEARKENIIVPMMLLKKFIDTYRSE